MTPPNKKPKGLADVLKSLGVSKPVIISALALASYGLSQVREVVVRPVVSEEVNELQITIDSSLSNLDNEISKSMTRGFYRMEKAMIKVNPKYKDAFNEVDSVYEKEAKNKARINKLLRGEL